MAALDKTCNDQIKDKSDCLSKEFHIKSNINKTKNNKKYIKSIDNLFKIVNVIISSKIVDLEQELGVKKYQLTKINQLILLSLDTVYVIKKLMVQWWLVIIKW